MRIVLAAAVLALVLPSSVAAEVILRPHVSEAAAQPVEGDAASAALASKVDEPASVLILPLYRVDTTSAVGTTTLFGVRNINNATLDLDVRYRSPNGDVERQDLVELGGRETLSVNIRDVAGLPVGPGGLTEGFVLFQVVDPPGAPIVGDYLQVDVGDNFATGDRLISLADLCDVSEIRFFDVGEGTSLTIVVNGPRGTGPMDPPTFIVTPIAEDGGTLAPTEVLTDEFVVTLTAADFTGLAFGNLVFDFSPASGGHVSARYSAEERFSVGINGACVMQ